MTRKYSDAAIVGTVGLVVAVTAAVGFAIGKASRTAPAYASEKLNTTIILIDDPQQGCRANKPQELRVKRTHKISWSISNRCSKPQFLRVDNFRFVKDDGSLGFAEGILEYPGQTDIPVAPNGGGVIAPVQVIKQTKEEAFYKYDVLISEDGTSWKAVSDPDIDIWP